MKGFVKLFIIASLVFGGIVFAKENVRKSLDTEHSVIFDEREYPILENDLNEPVSNREEIILWEENFENGENGWSLSSGWELTSDSYNSETHSALSPDNVANMNNVHNLLSPTISLPQLGNGETMNFGFWLWADQPGYSQIDDPSTPDDESTYLADYYSISVLDLAALAWHSSEHNGDGGNGANFWCADEDEVGGYLDSWIQYLDTPSISVGSGAELSVDILYAIESDAGASIGGSCTDGWDAANIRISSDGGASWELLEDPNNAYHFECGYGWIWNDTEYDTGGSLNHLAAGWGNDSGGWKNFNADLSGYAGQDVIIRFAFGSDPAYCTLDNSSITGFQVDNVTISDNSGTLYSNDGADESNVAISGEVWVDQFYDYGACADDRPGCSDEGWEEYVPGLAFNGNVFMDISDFAGKDVIFRFQSRYDDQQGTGQGTGLHIDDFKIYKISGGNYPEPMGLVAEAGDSEVMLSWDDMNASGTDNFVFDNDNVTNSIQMSEEGSTAFAGQRIDLAGSSTVNELHVFNVNAAGTEVTIAGFGALGTLIDNSPTYSADVVLQNEGWNIIDVDWSFENGYIVGHQFSYDVLVGLDESAVPSTNSMVLFSGGAWDSWSVAGAAVGDGEWGIRANITFEGANVSYNVYRDGVQVASGLSMNSYTDTGLMNNTTYEYTISATYSDGEESEESDEILATPVAQTVYESGYDDGTFEAEFNAGSGNFSAVKFSASSEGEDIVRFKWYQNGTGGAFYIKIFEDDGGMPGAEVYSAVQASGNSDGWNEKDLSTQGLVVSGTFWVGTKEFSSSKPFGLDTSSDSGNSVQRTGSSGDWTSVDGNLSYHVFLDCGENCGGSDCSNASGDVNEDGLINILDIVGVANAILGDALTGCSLEAADVNGDGMVNILDIVSIANIILGNRGVDASSATINKTSDTFSIDADGYIGGVQMVIEHSNDFSINLTEFAMLAKSRTEGNKTTLVVVDPFSNEIFTYNGEFEILDILVANSIEAINLNVPSNFSLGSAYPNPFNPSTSFNLYLPIESSISVKVYDVSGRAIATLLSGVQPQGNYDLVWDATDFSSGMYFVRAETSENVAIQKLLLIK